MILPLDSVRDIGYILVMHTKESEMTQNTVTVREITGAFVVAVNGYDRDAYNFTAGSEQARETVRQIAEEQAESLRRQLAFDAAR